MSLMQNATWRILYCNNKQQDNHRRLTCVYHRYIGTTQISWSYSVIPKIIIINRWVLPACLAFSFLQIKRPEFTQHCVRYFSSNAPLVLARESRSLSQKLHQLFDCQDLARLLTFYKKNRLRNAITGLWVKIWCQRVNLQFCRIFKILFHILILSFWLHSKVIASTHTELTAKGLMKKKHFELTFYSE